MDVTGCVEKLSCLPFYMCIKFLQCTQIEEEGHFLPLTFHLNIKFSILHAPIMQAEHASKTFFMPSVTQYLQHSTFSLHTKNFSGRTLTKSEHRHTLWTFRKVIFSFLCGIVTFNIFHCNLFLCNMHKWPFYGCYE